MEQLSLADYQKEKDRKPTSNPTGVILNGKYCDESWEDLFDENKYNKLICVSYVSSPNFFMKIADKFQTVKIIIGIEKAEVQNAFADSVNCRVRKNGEKFFEELPDKGKNRLFDNTLEIRYSKTNCIIHSKFYLLSNTETSENRLIFGSANLTKSAFSNAIKQYEDVMVFDNNPLYKEYLERFEHLYQETEDYVPRETIMKYKEGKLISFVDLTPEEMSEQFIKVLKDENIVPIINEEMIKAVQEIQSEEEKYVQETKATFEVITQVSKKKKGEKEESLVLKNDQELSKVKGKIVDVLFRSTKTETNIQRFSMTYNDADKKQYVVFPRKDDTDEVREPEMVDRLASKEEIHASIENIMKFVQAYKKFVANSDGSNDNLSRVFEVILYSFASAYIFKLRQEFSGSKSDIPIMLVIAGRAASGKSNLLAYIDKLLSGRQLLTEQHYYQYKQIEKKDAVIDLFTTDNTYPLLVDEVPQSFFSSKATNKGEELIKYLSNTLDTKHPVMICTTNTSTFNIPAQVARRIYFIKVDSCFDEKKKQLSNEYYDDVISSASNVLFRDFCARMGEKIKTNERLFGDTTSDFMFVVREIFKEYFNMAEIDIPDYFPKDLYKDYETRGISMWKTLFRQDRNSFTYTAPSKEKEATLTVNIKDLTNGQRDAQVYLNYLREDILVEEAGMYVVLKAKPFYEWIGERRADRLRNQLLNLISKK